VVKNERKRLQCPTLVVPRWLSRLSSASTSRPDRDISARARLDPVSPVSSDRADAAHAANLRGTAAVLRRSSGVLKTGANTKSGWLSDQDSNLNRLNSNLEERAVIAARRHGPRRAPRGNSIRYAPASGLPNSSNLALWHGRRNLRRSPSAGGARRKPLSVYRQISVESSGPLRTILVLSLVNTLNDAKPEDDLARRDDLLFELRELARPSYDAAFLDFRQFRFES
jgi:hypothetical protein